MSEVTTIGLDLAKNVFQAHGATCSGEVVFRKRLRREQVMKFFASQSRCLVAMEACASSHFWARALAELGHDVRLIPPAYVKPFVKRQKNDMADAEAICEAAQRPTMRFVAVKSEAKQAVGGYLPHPRSSGPAENPDHQRATWPYGRVRLYCSTGRGQCG